MKGARKSISLLAISHVIAYWLIGLEEWRVTYRQNFKLLWSKQRYMYHFLNKGEFQTAVPLFIIFTYEDCWVKNEGLTLKAPRKILEEMTVYFCFLFFRENNAWHYIWIICPADDSHVMSSIISSKNYIEHALKMSSASHDWRFKG